MSPKTARPLRVSRRALLRSPSAASDRQMGLDDRRQALAQPPFPHPKLKRHPKLNASNLVASCSAPLLSRSGDSSPHETHYSGKRTACAEPSLPTSTST